VVVGAVEVGARTVVEVAALCVPLELAHAVGPSAAARLIAARTRRRQTGISAHRNRDGAGTLQLASDIDRTAVSELVHHVSNPASDIEPLLRELAGFKFGQVDL